MSYSAETPTYLKMTGMLVIPFRVKKEVLEPIRMFSLKRCTAGIFCGSFKGIEP